MKTQTQGKTIAGPLLSEMELLVRLYSKSSVKPDYIILTDAMHAEMPAVIQAVNEHAALLAVAEAAKAVRLHSAHDVIDGYNEILDKALAALAQIRKEQ